MMMDVTLTQLVGQLFEFDQALTAARARVVELEQRIAELEKPAATEFDKALRDVVEAERTGIHAV